jgi:hypothetical protein
MSAKFQVTILQLWEKDTEKIKVFIIKQLTHILGHGGNLILYPYFKSIFVLRSKIIFNNF